MSKRCNEGGELEEGCIGKRYGNSGFISSALRCSNDELEMMVVLHPLFRILGVHVQ